MSKKILKLVSTVGAVEQEFIDNSHKQTLFKAYQQYFHKHRAHKCKPRFIWFLLGTIFGCILCYASFIMGYNLKVSASMAQVISKGVGI